MALGAVHQFAGKHLFPGDEQVFQLQKRIKFVKPSAQRR